MWKANPMVTNSGPDDLIMLHGFRLLSNSSEILAICIHIPSWIEIHRDLFELSYGKQIVNRQTDGSTDATPPHKLSGLQPVQVKIKKIKISKFRN